MLGVVTSDAGQILAIGGFHVGIGSSAALDIFDPKTGAWTVGDYICRSPSSASPPPPGATAASSRSEEASLETTAAVQVLGTDGHWLLSPGL